METRTPERDSHDTNVHVRSHITFNGPIILLFGAVTFVFVVILAFIFFAGIISHWHDFIAIQAPTFVRWFFVLLGIFGVSAVVYFACKFTGTCAVELIHKLLLVFVDVIEKLLDVWLKYQRRRLWHVDENKVVHQLGTGDVAVVPVIDQKPVTNVKVSEVPPAALPAPAITPEIPTGRALLLSGRVTQEIAQGYYLLGPTDTNVWKRIPCKKLFSTIIAGIPRVGKTTTVFWILTQVLLRGGRFFVIDPNKDYESEEGDKGLAGELEALADFMVFPACVGAKQELLDRLRYMYRELLQRKQPGYIVKNSDAILAIMDEFNSVVKVLSPKTVVVVHEEEELNFAQTLALLEREGPKYGLCFMLIGHKWTQQDIGGDNSVRTNATTYLCHKMNDERQANLLLSGNGKRILELPVGAYLATGPQFEEHATKIYTPMISARDIPIILEMMRERQQGMSAPYPSAIRGMSTPCPLSSTEDESGDDMEQPGQPSEITIDDEELPPDLRVKMLQVLQMDQMGTASVSKIIKEVWGVDPAHRQGRVASEQLNIIRAHIAKKIARTLQ